MASPEMHSLTLTEEQLGLLATLNVDQARIHIIRADSVHPTAVRVDGYATGHFVFFTRGTASEHQVFLRHLFGQDYSPKLKALYLGLSVYQSPTAQYVLPSNLVTINQSSEATIEY